MKWKGKRKEGRKEGRLGKGLVVEGEEEEVVSKRNVVYMRIWTLKWQWIVGELKEIV